MTAQSPLGVGFFIFFQDEPSGGGRYPPSTRRVIKSQQQRILDLELELSDVRAEMQESFIQEVVPSLAVFDDVMTLEIKEHFIIDEISEIETKMKKNAISIIIMLSLL